MQTSSIPSLYTEVTFPCASIIMQSARSLGHFLFLLEAICHIVSLCSVLYKSLTEDSIKVEMFKATIMLLWASSYSKPRLHKHIQRVKKHIHHHKNETHLLQFFVDSINVIICIKKVKKSNRHTM